MRVPLAMASMPIVMNRSDAGHRQLARLKPSSAIQLYRYHNGSPLSLRAKCPRTRSDSTGGICPGVNSVTARLAVSCRNGPDLRSVTVVGDFGRRMVGSAAAGRDRLPAGGKPSTPRAVGRQAPPAERQSTSTSGGQGEGGSDDGSQCLNWLSQPRGPPQTAHDHLAACAGFRELRDQRVAVVVV
jgi:hypothetical protein